MSEGRGVSGITPGASSSQKRADQKKLKIDLKDSRAHASSNACQARLKIVSVSTKSI